MEGFNFMGTSLKYFGTDGIRGPVGVPPITADFMLKFGWAIGKVFGAEKGKKVLIGKDPRISGYIIESALQAGLASAGMRIFLVGPMPTSAIAYLTQTLNADLGIVISASHNAFNDNGIKLFSNKGFKLPEATEREIEKYLQHQSITTADASELGKALRIDDAAGRYIEYCKSSISRYTHLENYKIVVDCANGATYHIAPHVYSELGAQVTPIHVSPDGFNINLDCGSNHPEVVRQHVLQTKSDLGIVFDGDGDRVVLVDHLGEILDGDEILYIIAKGMVESGEYNNGVILTHMSNTGVEKALNEMGLSTLRVSVGSHHVVKGLLDNKWLLGGEPSGHITYLRMNTTDDGIIASLLVLKTMRQTGKSLNELKQGMIKFPQHLANIIYNNVAIDLEDERTKKLIIQSKEKLGKHGRIIMRPSGTENVIRIMVEGENAMIVNEVAETLKEFVSKKI